MLHPKLAHGLAFLGRVKANMPDVVARSNRSHLERVRLAKEIEARILMRAEGKAWIEYVAGARRVVVTLTDDLGTMRGVGRTAVEALADLAGALGNVNLEDARKEDGCTQP